MASHHDHSRRIRERIYISGQLELLTPAHFGNGGWQGDEPTDISLLMDDVEGKALIPGTSIAGALRNYLRERLHGYHTPEPDNPDSPIAWLFGPTRGSKKDMDQSLLIVDDALASVQLTTLRDGVRIDPATGTARVETIEVDGKERLAGAKFDMDFLEEGSTFDLHFEVLITEKHTAEDILPYLVTALQGLENGEIRLGARKRRGFGQCRVSSWRVSRFRIAEEAPELLAWLETPPTHHRPDADAGKIAGILGDPVTADVRDYLDISATFNLDRSSILIRSGFGEADTGPDVEHLHAGNAQDGSRKPVISGTSWAGVIRHRALRIAKTLADDDARAERLVNELFGWMPKGRNEGGQASRVTTDETEIINGQTLYQTRVRIDRFTGGAYDGALFDEAPVYGKRDTAVGFHLHVRDPKSEEVGLLLLVLKDLWTRDLPVGGEIAVGRGRLLGFEATVELKTGTDARHTWHLAQLEPGLGLTPEAWNTLEGNFLKALQEAVRSAKEENDD
jgi:CRISPR/Cas system CSM-associated protein Csm3 (group 7 of RAMP superfamily)